MSAKPFSILILVFLLIFTIVIAQEDTTGGEGQVDYSSSDSWGSGVDIGGRSASDVGEGLQSNAFPADRISELSNEQLGGNMQTVLTSPDYASQLNSQQIVDNFRDVSGREANLDTRELSSALSQISGRNVQVDTGGQNINAREDENGNLRIDRANNLVVDGTTIIGGTGITIGQDILTVEGADQTIVGDTEISQLTNLLAIKKNFKVESADSIKLGCAKANNVKDSSFVVDEVSVAITTNSNVSYTVEDCGGTEYDYHNLDGDNVFTFTKTQNPTIFMKNVGINFSKETEDLGNFTEELLVEGSATVEINKQIGVTKAQITKGSYFFKTGNFDTDFVFRAEETNTLYFIKDKAQEVPECTECTVTNFLDKTITINGAIDYKRYWVQNNGKVVPGAKTVFKSSINGQAKLTFDKNLDVINKLEILSNNPPYTAQPNNYLTLEEKSTAEGTQQ